MDKLSQRGQIFVEFLVVFFIFCTLWLFIIDIYASYSEEKNLNKTRFNINR